MQELNLNTPNIESVLLITSQEHLTQATATLSTLNKDLDILTAHKEAKTKPLNAALKAIRADYKDMETQLEDAIAQVKTSITTYVTKQANEAKAEEARILADGRTSLATKIDKLALVDNSATDKVTTEQGSVSFTIIKKYSLSPVTESTPIKDIAQLVAIGSLVLDTTVLKAYIKSQGVVPNGITVTEEQSLRNYR